MASPMPLSTSSPPSLSPLIPLSFVFGWGGGRGIGLCPMSYVLCTAYFGWASRWGEWRGGPRGSWARCWRR
eukprot:scaffold47429_cov36-Tisochrysis_lutea.AAC.1